MPYSGTAKVYRRKFEMYIFCVWSYIEGPKHNLTCMKEKV